MATGNIDCPLPKLSSTCFTTIEFMRANSAAMTQEAPPTTYAELQKVIDSNIGLRVIYRPIQEAGESLNNKCAHTPNNNIELDTSCEKIPTSKPSCSCFSGVNGNDQQRYENGVSVDNPLVPGMLGSVIQEELSISVDSEEESGHSWRPSLGNSLSSDFFLTQPNPAASHLPLLAEGDCPGGNVPLHLPLLESENKNEPSGNEADEGCSPCTSNLSHSRHDVQSYVQSQKAELNILKYEVMNARRTINESRCAIGKLDRRLIEVLNFQNSQEIEKLSTENAQLRLECQCYCMEVDFYLRGCSITAPLGEVDEKFYVENIAAQSKKSEAAPHAAPQPKSNPDYKDEDPEENDKWECHKCTFANHPAIYCCEMCQVPRLRRERPPLLCFPDDECFCHPKEHGQSS